MNYEQFKQDWIHRLCYGNAYLGRGFAKHFVETLLAAVTEEHCKAIDRKRMGVVGYRSERIEGYDAGLDNAKDAIRNWQKGGE